MSLEDMINDNLTVERIPDLLRCIANNINQDYINQLLIFSHNKNAERVAGRHAFLVAGGNVNQCDPIDLVYPKLIKSDDGVGCEYVGIQGYSIADVDGLNIEKNNDVLGSYIAKRLGMTIEEWDDDEFDSSENVIIEEESHVIGVREGYPKNDLNDFLINHYIGLSLSWREPFPDHLARAINMAVTAVVRMHYDMQAVIVGSTFEDLERMPLNDKYEFLKAVIGTARMIIQDIEGYSLSFQELSVYNQLIRTDNIGDICFALADIRNQVYDSDIREVMIVLKKKLSGATDDNIRQLATMRENNQLFTYPGIKLVEQQNGIFVQRKQGILY